MVLARTGHQPALHAVGLDHHVGALGGEPRRLFIRMLNRGWSEIKKRHHTEGE